MKKTIKTVAFLLVAVMLVCLLVSCSSYGKPIMTLADKSISVNVYQLLLSRMKDNVETYYDKATTSSFWDTKISLDGSTYADFFEASVLEQASLYLSAEYLFDRNGLILEDERVEKVDALMETLVKLKGSKSNLNADLKQYGANFETLRSLYILETKMDMLKDHLYGDKGEKITEEDKDKYLFENYVAFGQIFIPSYYYVEALDKNEDRIYYTDEKQTAIAYDKVNGATKLNEFGQVDKDSFQNPIYYAEDGSIAYDKVNGVAGFVLDKDGNKVADKYDDAKKKELFATAEKYASECDGDIEKFLEYCGKYDGGDGENKGEAMFLYTESGYYSLFGESSSYLDTIASELLKIGVGECAMVESAYGYHVVCRYEMVEGAYDDEKQKDVFLDFYDSLVAKLFEEECKKYEGGISIDVEILEGAIKIKDIPSNSLY